MPTIRGYRPETDQDTLWRLKQAFERELAETTGDDAKTTRYQSKLDAEYRERYLEWVTRCQTQRSETVLLGTPETATAPAGYIFLLPEEMAMIWDAAVINELYVAPQARGTGLADALITRALEVAADQDLPLDRILLDVDADNPRAQTFYARYDFEPWGEVLARPLPAH